MRYQITHMKTIDEIRRANLLTAIERAGNARKLADISGVASAYISQVKTLVPQGKSGKPRGLGDDAAARIARAIGEEPAWMDTDHEPSRAELPGDKGNVLTWDTPDDLPLDPNRVWVDRYDYSFSAGTGMIQWEIREKHALPFDVGFFKKLGSDPRHCKLCIVRGDSMEPFLFNRDLVMIDCSKVRIKDGHIYAIIFEDEALVKKVFKQAGGGLVLHSYNDRLYPDKEIPPEKLEFIRIAGEVIYRSGSGPAGGN